MNWRVPPSAAVPLLPKRPHSHDPTSPSIHNFLADGKGDSQLLAGAIHNLDPSIHNSIHNFLAGCKVVIPRGTGRSYGIRWRSEMQVTDETKGDGRTDGWKDGRSECIAQV